MSRRSEGSNGSPWRPDEIHFFDDLPVNVAAARELGVDAFLVRGPRDVESILLSNGSLSPAGT
jgi:FMN phosphatase YigB (HAD superfamily)